MTLALLRALAVSRSLFAPTSLQDAIETLGFVQADPIRAPARAQDLTLRHRVAGYRAGDLERRYPELDVEEDVFINYGFVTRTLHGLMHPRTGAGLRPTARHARANDVLAFVRERGTVHPREVDAEFSPGTVTNYWGGSSSATTHLLESMHYKGLLRVARREQGIRVYAIGRRFSSAGHEAAEATSSMTAAERRARIDELVDAVVRKYAPLPAASLAYVVARLRYAAPQWHSELPAALKRAKQRLRHERVDGIDWYWTEDDVGRRFSGADADQDAVRLLAPFDPVVWDRRRFELLWGWAYRFEAYTPEAKRKLGYYALPLLWRDQVIGWGNVSMKSGKLDAAIGYIGGRAPRDKAFKRELEAEIERMRRFLS
jgi:uncharacterized protein